MKVLYEASVVFHVLDDLTGETLGDAAVFCVQLGKGSVRSSSGCHVFTDLPPGAYEFHIFRAGYGEQRVTVSHSPGGGLEVHTVRLLYSQTHPQLAGRRHLLFLLSDETGPLAERQITILLCSPSPLLRVVEDAPAGGTCLTLNSEPRAELLRRELLDERGMPHFLKKMMPKERAYRLSRPLEKPLRCGARLLPLWRFETDREGAAVLPIDPLLMPPGGLFFTVCCGGRERTARVEPFTEYERRVELRFLPLEAGAAQKKDGGVEYDSSEAAPGDSGGLGERAVGPCDQQEAAGEQIGGVQPAEAAGGEQGDGADAPGQAAPNNPGADGGA